MKHFVFLLFLSVIATGSFATEKSQTVEIIQTDLAKVIVAVNEAPLGAIIVKIKDESNRLILRDRINQTEAFAKRYDLNSLPKGTYSIEVTDHEGILRKLQIQNFEPIKETVYSSVAKLGVAKYKLLVSSLESAPFSVAIYDGDKLIHSEQVADAKNLHKIYTIKNPTGAISFRVTSADGFDKYVSAR